MKDFAEAWANHELWGGWLIPAPPPNPSPEENDMTQVVEKPPTAVGLDHQLQAAELRRKAMRRRLQELKTRVKRGQR